MRERVGPFRSAHRCASARAHGSGHARRALRLSLALAGSPPSAKLLNPPARRDGREAEGARLESEAGHPHQAASTYLNVNSLKALVA